ncbi:MAG: hypothetical protein C0410_13795 [Anaerolinea sp.]|nr:hypothetical protein [Anaerolinea sp.]
MKNSNISPTSDDGWKIHSLNIHGGFFEQKIASIVNNCLPNQLYYITSEYPVEVSNEESRLDVLGFLPNTGNPGKGIYFPIECKKHNPDFIDWIFYPTVQNKIINPNYSYYSHIELYTAKDENGYSSKIGMIDKLFPDIPISSDCREVRGNYSNVPNGTKTKTANNSITEASYQVTLATHSLVNEHFKLNEKQINDNNEYLFGKYIYIPIIVTTANLFFLDYSIDNIEISSGEIDTGKVKLDPIDMLWYEYPIPPHLQLEIDLKMPIRRTTVYNLRKFDYAVRRDILIVNANKFENALKWLLHFENLLFD